MLNCVCRLKATSSVNREWRRFLTWQGLVDDPWKIFHGRKNLAEWAVNRYTFEKVVKMGPDLACLEWLMNCGSTEIVMSDGTAITTQKQMREYIAQFSDYSTTKDITELNNRNLITALRTEASWQQRWSHVPKVYIRQANVSDSAIADPGFHYFSECNGIEKMIMHFCDFFTDEGMKILCRSRSQLTLKELEIVMNPHITDLVFEEIAKLRVLSRAHFYFNPWVTKERQAVVRLRQAFPKLTVTYPKTEMVGTGKKAE